VRTTSLNPSPARERLAAGLVNTSRLAFAALLFVSPFAWSWNLLERRSGNVFSSYTDFWLFLSDLFLLLTLGFWLLSRLARPRPLRRGPWFLTVPIVGLVTLSWVGVFTGIDPALTLYHSIRFTLLLGLYLFLVDVNPAPLWIVVPLALGLVIQTFVAIGQFNAQHSIGLAAWGELSLDPKDSGTSIVRVGEARVLRAYGLTDHPNVLGGFIAFGLVLLLGYFLSAPIHSRARYLALLPLALGGVGLLLTFSRAAAVGFLAGVLLEVFVIPWLQSTRARRSVDVALAGTIMLAVTAVPLLANQELIAVRLGQNNAFEENSNEQRSLAEREALMASTNRLFYKHEIIGVGNGALPLAMYRLDDQFQIEYYYQPAHFVLLDAAAELGLVGGMVWLWLLVVPAPALWLKRGQVVARPWLAVTGAALLVMTIVGFYDYYPWLGAAGRLWQWSAWGLFGAAYQALAEDRKAFGASIDLGIE
jgi:hypothetical protein